MSENRTENPGNRTEHSEIWNMTAVAEAATLLKRIAEPRPVGDTVKQAINRAARRVSRFLPMRPGRVEDIWREEARAIRAEEMDAIRRAAEGKRLQAEAQDELAQIDARIARLEALLVSDEDYFGPQVDEERAALGRLRRSLDGGER